MTKPYKAAQLSLRYLKGNINGKWVIIFLCSLSASLSNALKQFCKIGGWRLMQHSVNVSYFDWMAPEFTSLCSSGHNICLASECKWQFYFSCFEWDLNAQFLRLEAYVMITGPWESRKLGWKNEKKVTNISCAIK